MIEQINNSITFFAFFTSAKQGKTGLSPTIDVYRGTTSVVTAGAMSAIGGGLYYYTYTATTEENYTAICKTSDATVDQQHIPALWVVGKAGIENLDASINSRSTYAGADTAGTTTLLGRLSSQRATNLDFLDASVVESTQDVLDAVDGIPTAPTPQQIWEHATRTLTSFGTLVDDIAAEISGALTAEQAEQLQKTYEKILIIGTQGLMLFGPRLDGKEYILVEGASYTVTNGLAPLYRSDNWMDLTGAVITLRETNEDQTIVTTGEVVSSGGQVQVVGINFPSSITSTMDKGSKRYHIFAVIGAGDPMHLGDTWIRLEH